MKDLQLPEDMLKRVERRAKRTVEKWFAPKQGLKHFEIQAFPFSCNVTVGGYSTKKQAQLDHEAQQSLQSWVDSGKPKPPFWTPEVPYRDKTQQLALPGGVNYQTISRKLKEEIASMKRPLSSSWTNPPGGWMCSAGACQRSLPLVHHATRRLEILR